MTLIQELESEKRLAFSSVHPNAPSAPSAPSAPTGVLFCPNAHHPVRDAGAGRDFGGRKGL